jgi:hypothetical protein
VGFYGTTNIETINECGQFLVNTSETNTIENKFIKDIIIYKGPNNGS